MVMDAKNSQYKNLQSDFSSDRQPAECSITPITSLMLVEDVDIYIYIASSQFLSRDY